MLTRTYPLENWVLNHWLSSQRKNSTRAPQLPLVPTNAEALSSIDPSAVESICKLREAAQSDLYMRLVDVFSSTSTVAVAQLNEAVETMEWRAAGRICHKMASGAANVGALSFSKALRRLEQFCKAGDHANVVTVNDLVQRAHPNLMAELQGRVTKSDS